MIPVILIDPDANAIQNLRQLLNQYCPNIKIVAEANNGKGALSYLKRSKVEAIFLDTNLHSATGFEILNNSHTKGFKTIFTSTSESFALQALRYNALDYLLKPIEAADLIRAVDKLGDSRKVTTNHLQVKPPTDQRVVKKIALKVNEGIYLLRLKDIIRLEANGRYTTFYTREGKSIMVSKNIKEYSDLLPQEFFSRPHQSHIVHLDFVKKVLKEDGGYIIMEDNTKIPISRRKKERFINALRNRSLY